MKDEQLMLRWGIRESLLHYMTADESFQVDAAGGAAFDPSSGVRIPARMSPDGVIACTGDIVLSAHDGALTVPLVGVVIDGGALWIRDPEEPDALMRLVTVGAPVREGRRTTWQASLAPDADLMFRYMYTPAATFSPIVVEPQSAG